MSNFDITELLTDGRTDEWKAGTYVAKSGGQGNVSCKVRWLFSLELNRIQTLT